jgi:hypothetical protein
VPDGIIDDPVADVFEVRTDKSIDAALAAAAVALLAADVAELLAFVAEVAAFVAEVVALLA